MCTHASPAIQQLCVRVCVCARERYIESDCRILYRPYREKFSRHLIVMEMPLKTFRWFRLPLVTAKFKFLNNFTLYGYYG